MSFKTKTKKDNKGLGGLYTIIVVHSLNIIRTISINYILNKLYEAQNVIFYWNLLILN